MKTIRTACTRHCGDGCSLLVTPGPGDELHIRGNPDHPFTAGLCCGKTRRFGERVCSPRRIVTPLIRDGDGFEEISWDEAFGLIADQIDGLRDAPEHMLHLQYYASFGLLYQASKYLFKSLGASTFYGSPCLAAGAQALRLDCGALREEPLSRAMQSPRIVNWGRNAGAQSVHLAAMLAGARRNGSRILAIHPGDAGYRGQCDEEIIIRPGTDRFLALAVLKLLQDREQLDAGAMSRCRGVDAFLEALAAYTMDTLCSACGVSGAQVARVADMYASNPTATLIGRGLQRYARGGETVRCINALAMLSGQIGRTGGGTYYMRPSEGQVQTEWTEVQPGYSRALPLADLARSMAEADPPVEFVWIEGMNVVTQCPGSEQTAAMLQDRFTVVVEAFMTDTARCATLILPPALMLECEDVLVSEMSGCIHHAAQVVEPRGQSRSNFAIARTLGAMLAEPVVLPEGDAVMDTALRRGWLFSSLDELREKGWLSVPESPSPWADGKFAHPDGLYHLPEFVTPPADHDAEFPLHLLSTVQRKYLLSQIPENEQGQPTVYVSPHCAALNSVQPGSDVLLETRHGALPVRLELRDGLHPEAVYYPRGDWMAHGGCVNRVIGPHTADLGGQIAYYEERARLAPLEDA